MNEPRIFLNDPRSVNSPRKLALAARVEAVLDSEDNEELATKAPAKVSKIVFKEPLHPRDLSGKFIKNPFTKKKPAPLNQITKDLSDIRDNVSINGDQGFKDVLVGLALGAINEVHGVKGVPKLNITQKDLTKYRARGLYYTDTNNVAVDTSSAKDVAVSLIHEIGHWLDSRMGNLRYDTKLIAALESSKTMKRLREYFSPSSYSTAEERATGAYILSPKEVFARAYSQYVVSRSSNKVLKRELKDRQAIEGSLWEDNDFEPIGKEFDRIFKTKPKKK